jgi:aryl-alcohol dehydrogenase-like predicted oxidoreductase
MPGRPTSNSSICYTRKLERLDENLGAVAIELTSDDLSEIATATSKIEVQGARGTGQERYV